MGAQRLCGVLYSNLGKYAALMTIDYLVMSYLRRQEMRARQA